MNNTVNQKAVTIVHSEAIVDNAAFTTVEVDTIGFNHAKVVIFVGTTDVVFTTLKMTSSNVAGSGHADITGADFDGSTDIDGNTSTLPSATDDNKFFIVDLDLRGIDRYLDLSATAGNGAAGTWMNATCILSEPDEGLITAADMGADTVLSV